MHLNRPGRQAEQASDFLGLQVASDQAQDLALTRGEALEAVTVAGFHHTASMPPVSRDVQTKWGDRGTPRHPCHRVSVR